MQSFEATTGYKCWLLTPPITFSPAISFLLFCAVNAAKPNKPRHETTIVNPAKYFDNADILVFESYCF